jgi:hypothetical protein
VAQGTPDQLKLDVAARLGLDHPATLTEVFLAYTGRDWEEDEADDEEDDDNETDEIDEMAENEAHGVQEGN